MSKVIGLTGGIGSGKSTVAKMFAELGVPVFYADDEARLAMNSPEILEELRQNFGDGIFDEDGLNRQRLAKLVFEDKDQLARLNGLIHPRVAARFGEWMRNQAKASFVIREAAILFESGSYRDCEKIITVTAPREVRMQRVMQRDSATREQVEARMAHQWDDARKLALSDFHIRNTELSETRRQVLKIFKTLKNI